MTFCVAAKVDSGLVALADTRIVKGNEQSSKGKVAHVHHSDGSLFFMTSGLRSVRDKTSIYFENSLAEKQKGEICHLFEAANLFGECLRRVKEEDGASLAAANLSFNLHAIIGGKFSADKTPFLFYIYPQGNWVEATSDAPYHMIGQTSYGKPILDRLLSSSSSLPETLALLFLAFDGTRASVTDVGFPIDCIVLDGDSGALKRQRFTMAELQETTHWWTNTLQAALANFPREWSKDLFEP
jgi:putative proteasome-type protease